MGLPCFRQFSGNKRIATVASKAGSTDQHHSAHINTTELQQLLIHLNLHRWLESQEGMFCSGFYQNLAIYGRDKSAGFDRLIALMRNQSWGIERNALLRRPMSITARILICRNSVSGPFQ